MNEPRTKIQYMCECGAVAKFFQLESGKHVCEQCTLNEIYAEESYQDVYGKVMLKMRNIMNLRTKQMLVKQQIAARDQARRIQNSIEEEKEPPMDTKKVPLPT